MPQARGLSPRPPAPIPGRGRFSLMSNQASQANLGHGPPEGRTPGCVRHSRRAAATRPIHTVFLRSASPHLWASRDDDVPPSSSPRFAPHTISLARRESARPQSGAAIFDTIDITEPAVTRATPVTPQSGKKSRWSPTTPAVRRLSNTAGETPARSARPSCEILGYC